MFLNEHRKVEEQEAMITHLNSTVEKQEATIAQQQKDFEGGQQGSGQMGSNLTFDIPDTERPPDAFTVLR